MSDVDTRGFNPVNFLRNAMRNSPWIVMAVALHLILAAFALIFYANKTGPSKIEDTTQISMAQHKVEEEVVIPPEIIDRKAIPKNEEAELVPYELDVYTPSTEQEDLHMEHGDPNAADNAPPGATGGTAIGVGNSGHAGSGRPSPFSSRKLGGGGGKGRGGATQGTDKAVLDGLRWLCRHQNEDGSWSPTTLNDRCPCDDPMYNPKAAYSKNYDEGLTGMALLCFLGAGFSHESKQDIVDTAMGKRYKVGTVVKNGLQWLVKRQGAEGSFGNTGNPFMYNEALAGMAVAEAYGLTQNRFWKEPAQKSMNFIMGAQRPNPTGQGLWGWRYDARQTIEAGNRGGSMDEATKKELFDSDTSVTGWCIMALKSGRLSGLEIKDENMAGGAAFARFVTADNGMVGYLDAKTAGATVQGKNDFYTYHPSTMSSLGMCIRIFSEHNPDDPFLDLAAKQVVKDLPAVSKENPPISVDYYYWYYGSLALNQIDGPDAPKKTNKYWGPWNKAMVDAVLGLQDHKERACTNGGWMVPDRWSYDGGPIYTTALNVLTLEVYYRYENAFGGSKRN